MSAGILKLLRLVLFHAVGRPIRKLLFIAVETQKWTLQLSNKLFHKYARLLAIVCDCPDPKWFITQTVGEADAYFKNLAHRVRGYPIQPKISIILPVYKIDPEIFRETLATVDLQCYENWELCVVDDASGDARLAEMIERFASDHPGQVKFAINGENVHISATSNRCIEMATGDYLALLDHDDRLVPNALAEMVRYINLHNEPDILYSDERVIEQSGTATHLVYCKPGWSPFLHLSCNYTTHFTLYRTELIRELGGFRVGYEGSQDHDLMLRATEASPKPVVHVPFCLYQWRATETSTAKSADTKPYAAQAGIRAVTDACRRRGRPAVVEWEAESFHYRVRFELPKEPPLVSLLIPTKDNGALLEGCLQSIFEKTSYANFEVILIDNGSTTDDALSVMTRYETANPGRVRILRKDGPFNFAALNNQGAAIARGEYLVLLNNDTTVESPEWIEEMLRYAQFPEVGAVGCKLLYPNGQIQHAGLELQDRRIANHSFKYMPEETTAYSNNTKTAHEVSAVTGACMMIAAAKYCEMGGLDELYLPNGYGDVDFCLRLIEAGYSNVYTPYAKLIHHESCSRGRVIETFERHYMVRRWGHQLMNDPYLNFNLTRNMLFQIDPEFCYLDPTGREFQELIGSAEKAKAERRCDQAPEQPAVQRRVA